MNELKKPTFWMAILSVAVGLYLHQTGSTEIGLAILLSGLGVYGIGVGAVKLKAKNKDKEK